MSRARTTSSEDPTDPRDSAITETSVVTAADAKADSRVPVYVKISQRSRDILDAAATDGRTRATVLENLLESFNKQSDPKVREGILQGQNPNSLKDHGELLQLRSWAEHAFENKRYFWAGGMYRILANHHSSTEGLRNICHYRLSLCLIRLSYDVRAEALERGVDQESFDLALKTLDEAIRYTRALRDRIDSENFLFPKLVLYYNLASCHALKAQYMVESELDPRSDEVDRLQKARKEEEKEEVWKAIGQDWRNKLQLKIDKQKASRDSGKELIALERKKSDIDSEASKAFDELTQIVPAIPLGKTFADLNLGLSSERTWLVDSTLKDEDLIFLRLDTQRWQPIFTAWRNEALQDRKPNSYMVRSLLVDASDSSVI